MPRTRMQSGCFVLPSRHLLVLLLAVMTLTGGTFVTAVGQSVPSFQPQASALWSGADRGPLTRPFAAAGEDTGAHAPAEVRPTHWKKGAIIGGIVVGALGGTLVGGLCGMSDDPDHTCTGAVLGGAVVGALVGGILGALIGGQFPK